MPFIFAYSGFLPRDKIEETKKAGFDGCFELLTAKIVTNLIHIKIDKFVETYIMNHLTDIEQWEKLNAIITNQNGTLNSSQSSEEQKIE